jgi:hypothetical protein
MNTTTATPLCPGPACGHIPAAARTVLQAAAAPAAWHLTVQLPDGTLQHFGPGGPAAADHAAQLERVQRRAAVGRHRLCRELHRGRLDHAAPDRPAQALHRQPPAGRSVIYGSWAGRLLYRIKHLLNRNTRANSQKNIHAHYDLGNAFYRAVAGRHDELFVGLVRGRCGRRHARRPARQGAPRAAHGRRAAGRPRAGDRLRLGRAGRDGTTEFGRIPHGRDALDRAAGFARARMAAPGHRWSAGRPTCACRTTATSTTAPTTRSAPSKWSRPWAANTGPPTSVGPGCSSPAGAPASRASSSTTACSSATSAPPTSSSSTSSRAAACPARANSAARPRPRACAWWTSLPLGRTTPKPSALARALPGAARADPAAGL